MQRLSAGKGIVHSEMNEHDEVEHNIQIWILPDQKGHEPGYEMKRYEKEERTGRLRLYVSPEGREDSMRINQDAEIYAGILQKGDRYEHDLKQRRGAWLQVVHGKIRVNDDVVLNQGDGAGITNLSKVKLEAMEESELILFDVAMEFETPYRID
jgi:redox-sensitive bicupin YhaK (pirin superfamily)